MSDTKPGDAKADVLVIIPTYNEKENIERIVPAVLARSPKIDVLVVDDNSPDGTGGIADRMAKTEPRLSVLHRPGKEGLGRAYLDGFAWALARGYRYVFEFDADFSHDPKYLPEMIDLLRTKADVVIGSRRVPGGGIENWSLPRRAISYGGSLYARAVLGVPIRDLTGGFNGFRREVFEEIGLEGFETTGYGFQIELKYRAIQKGFTVVEVPIVFPDRVAGKSKMNGSIFLEAMTKVVRLRLGG